MPSLDTQVPDDITAALALRQNALQLTQEIGRRVVGQSALIEHMLITLFAGGHALFVGVPGLAKTLVVRTLAQAMGLSFRRIQFTPDLMPSDITGTQMIEEVDGRRTYRFRPGPLFAQLVLADEINRTPPKTQAALLESMQEGSVTSDGQQHRLGPPFHVFATQNPLEQEGTYPLPEAQLDRFMFMLEVGYPTFDEELEVVRQTPQADSVTLTPQLSAGALMRHQALVRRVPLAESLLADAVRWVRRTRPQDNGSPALVKASLSYGAGPRAAQALVMAARARALMHGRFAVDQSDLLALVRPVLRHRLILNFHAEAEGTSVDAIIDAALADKP